MGDLYDTSRMCSAPGTENRGLDLLRLKPATPQNFTPLTAGMVNNIENFLPTQAQIQAELEKSQKEFEALLEDSGITAKEFYGVVGYIRDSRQYGYNPNAQDLENFILSMRPSQPRFPGVVDHRLYHIWGLQGLAFFTNPIVIAVIGIAVDFVPILGEIKMIYETISGKDAITGDSIPTWARVLGPLGFGPIAVFVAVADRAPAEALRMLNNLASMEQTTLKVALAEAEAVKSGALKIGKAQRKALQDVGSLLSAPEVAKIEKQAAKKAAQTLDNGLGGPSKKLPDMPDALPIGETKRTRAPRRPKKTPKPTPGLKPPREFYKIIKLGYSAYRRLIKRGLQVIPLSDYFKKQDFGIYQIKQAGGRVTEFLGELKDGRKVQIDNLADSTTEAGKLDVIEMKFGNPYIDINTIERSGHLRFANSKADQVTRLAKFAAENSGEIGRVKILASNATVAEIYLNILHQHVPANLRKYVDVLDEELNIFTK
jgi:Pre-toxin TG